MSKYCSSMYASKVSNLIIDFNSPKIINFLQLNAHLLTQLNQLYLFERMKNFGCYNSTPLKMNLVLEIRVIAYSNSWG